MPKRTEEDQDQKDALANQKILEDAKSDEETIEVAVKDPEEAEEESEEVSSGRDEKKRARGQKWREHQDRADTAERSAAEARAQVAFYQEQERLRTAHAQQQQQRDPFADEEAQVKREYDLYLKETDTLQADKITPEERQKYRDQWFSLQQKMQGLSAKKQFAQSGAGQQQNPEAVALRATYYAKYPDVMVNDRAVQAAQARWMAAQAEGRVNQKDPWSTMDQVMNDVRRAFGIGKAPPADEVTRRRYSAVGGGSSQASEGAPRAISMGKAERKIALAAYPQFASKPEKAYQAWANAEAKDRTKEGRKAG